MIIENAYHLLQKMRKFYLKILHDDNANIIDPISIKYCLISHHKKSVDGSIFT